MFNRTKSNYFVNQILEKIDEIAFKEIKDDEQSISFLFVLWLRKLKQLVAFIDRIDDKMAEEESHLLRVESRQHSLETKK